MSKQSKKPVAIAIGTAFAATLAAAPVTADINPFQVADLGNGYMVADKGAEAKCGEAKCGESKSAPKKVDEAKCGEGKAASEAKCGENKPAPKPVQEAKCGEAKCGGNK